MLDVAITPLLPIFARCRAVIGGRDSEFERVFGGGVYDLDQDMVLFSEEWWDVLFVEGANFAKNGQEVPVDDGRFSEAIAPAFPTPSNHSSVGLERHSIRTSFQREHPIMHWTVDTLVQQATL